MKTKIKVILPIYGVAKSVQKKFSLDKNILLRPIDFLSNEHELFKKHKIYNYSNTVIELDYKYDRDSPSEPLPGMEINFIQLIESALRVYGKGDVGIAGIVFSKNLGSKIRTVYKPLFANSLKETLDNFPEFFKKFQIAYDSRPLAFQVYSRLRDRYSDNDKTVDACTVLEALFVPAGETQKSSFIKQGMAIMGFEKSDLEKINDLIIYRNSIIHADLQKIHWLLGGHKYTSNWFEETFELVRKITAKFVEKPFKL